MKTPFLKCCWNNLLYINFKINPQVILHLLPEDVEPILIDNKTILSLVCFEFSEAQFFGIKIPFHQYFPEINVRLYVQKKNNPQMNGVYFISEMVPKFFTYFVAKFIFGEPFVIRNIHLLKSKKSLEYNCKSRNLEVNFNINIENGFIDTMNKEQDFVINREYAFCGEKGKSSKIFRVKHRPWKLIKSSSEKIRISRLNHLPEKLQSILLQQKPSSVFVTDGSEVEVLKCT